jgi:hypothetical protein
MSFDRTALELGELHRGSSARRYKTDELILAEQPSLAHPWIVVRSHLSEK